MENNITLGEKLKERRLNKGLTLKEVSNATGISIQLISDYENQRKEPGVKNIKSLCMALGITPNYLLSDSELDLYAYANNYGLILSNYLTAIEKSINDELIIDKNKREVTIKIKDDILVNTFIQLEPFMGNEEMYKVMKNFNINILSAQEVKNKNGQN